MATKPTPKPAAADKRKAADKALDDRIAARKASAKKPEAAPFVPDPPADLEAATTKAMEASKPAKTKRTPKPRVNKTEAAVDVSGLVERISEKATKKAATEHKKNILSITKLHATTMSMLKAQHKSVLKGMVSKEAAAEAEKKAYAAGVKAGAKDSTKGILAALKGR
jgi:hypothetical protein